MQITDKALLAIIPYTDLQAKLKIGAAVRLTRRHFCSQMTTNNLCPMNCPDCAARILSALKNIEKAANPAGMYVVRLRHEYASVAEAQAKPEDTPKQDAMGLPVEREDIFEDLLAEVS
jgi:copper chaperone CopZ